MAHYGQSGDVQAPGPSRPPIRPAIWIGPPQRPAEALPSHGILKRGQPRDAVHQRWRELRPIDVDLMLATTSTVPGTAPSIGGPLFRPGAGPAHGSSAACV